MPQDRADIKRIDNPPNPYVSAHHEWLEPPPARVEVYEETAKSILSENDSPDIPFRWSANPYRGCQHGCAYCYARPTHEYLGFGAGTDFETRIVVKTNAAELLDKAFSRPKWRREAVNFSGVTDCYQPVEATYGITRACLEVCLRHRNPVGIVTRGFLIVRDVDLLAELDAVASAHVYVSIPIADAEAARLIEPQAPPPERRFEIIRRLSEAGLHVGVFIAPVIPGLNDREIPDILRRASEAGARSASYAALHLPGSVQQVFLDRLREAMPDRAARIESRIREMRGGVMGESRFVRRMKGQGAYWRSIQELFRVAGQRYGFRDDRSSTFAQKRLSSATLSSPTKNPHAPADRQMLLSFGDGR
ncbi:MAG: PA0069 family radical SAM protein [Planctomycetota bacterium]|nr:PA0069 family radical SAM protein [Planctomycetota bacterium]